MQALLVVDVATRIDFGCIPIPICGFVLVASFCIDAKGWFQKLLLLRLSLLHTPVGWYCYWTFYSSCSKRFPVFDMNIGFF